MNRVSVAQRNRVRLRARNLCEYCLTNSDYAGHDFTVDHIKPESEGGTSNPDNLCLCCFWCNNFKKSQTHFLDPRTNARIPLFNPRVDIWQEHFRWSPTKTRITGRTAVGRATVVALRLNRPILVRARSIWTRNGLHPPR